MPRRRRELRTIILGKWVKVCTSLQSFLFKSSNSTTRIGSKEICNIFYENGQFT